MKSDVAVVRACGDQRWRNEKQSAAHQTDQNISHMFHNPTNIAEEIRPQTSGNDAVGDSQNWRWLAGVNVRTPADQRRSRLVKEGIP